jgi:hypothetical protein
MTWSELDCSNPNPDRGIYLPIAIPIDTWMDTGDHDVTEYLPFIIQGIAQSKGKPTR